MADLSQYRVLGLRASLVALGVVSLFGLKSLISSPEEIHLSALGEVPAGTPTELVVQAEPDSTVVLEWTQPNGLVNSSELELNGQGQSTYTFDEEALSMVGAYELTARYEHHRLTGAELSFEVVAGMPDLAQSRISFSSAVLNPNQSVQMSVRLADAFGNPVSGHSLSVQSSASVLQVFSSEFVTNADGQMNFTLLGEGEGIVSLSLYDATAGQNILAPTHIALVGGPAFDDDVQLAETGPVDSFVITGLDNETEPGTEQTITVKAIDSEGFTVVDYTGTIRFSSSDDQATLPNDYTFLDSDQGEHTFSLGVKFVTLGAQTLSVTDVDDVQVNGDEGTTVTQSQSSSNDYDSNFETTDFEREGDFTLSSPATGSYSDSSVEVQGEAEYGNTAVIFVNGEEAGSVEVDFDNSFTYSLEDLSDGNYVIYVEIQDENETLIESSDSESVTIDTTAPDLVSISSDPEGNMAPGTEVVVTVLSESGMEESTVIFQDEVTTLEETGTAGKYQATIIAPDAEGDYGVDVLLSDPLGNEVELRDQLTISVGAIQATQETTNDTTPTESDLGQVVGLMATGGDAQVSLSWEAVDSTLPIAYYRIYYGPSPSSLFAVSETSDSSTNWTIPDLTPGEYYYFALAGVDIEGNESTVSDAVLGVPTGSAEPVHTTPDYPVSTTITETVQENPETGPASSALLVLSSLGAMGYVLLRKRARA